MESALLIVHILVAICIVGLVLIQHGKGADAGAAFGGGGGGASGSVFGSQGSGNFLSRSTGMLATVFFLTSLSLAYLAKNVEGEKSLMERTQEALVVEVAPEKSETDAPMVPKSEVPKSEFAESDVPGNQAPEGAPDIPKNP